MRFDEEPNLDYTRKLFRDLYEARGYDQVQGKMWDWEPSGAISSIPAAANASAAAATTAAKKTAGVAERPSTTPAVEENPVTLERSSSAGGNKKQKQKNPKNSGVADDDNESLEPKLGEEVGDTGLQTRPTTAGGLVGEDGAMVVDNA